MNASLYNTACVVMNRTALCFWLRAMQYFDKGAANLCGVVEIINEEFSDEAILKKAEDRLMPRTEELPLYTTHEFNAKVVAGVGGCRSRFFCGSAFYLILYFSTSTSISIDTYMVCNTQVRTYISLNISPCFSTIYIYLVEDIAMLLHQCSSTKQWSFRGVYEVLHISLAVTL